MDPNNKTPFELELRALINRHSRENGSNTPDFILAEYLNDCLKAFDGAVRGRSLWYGAMPNERDIVDGKVPGLPIQG